MFADFARIAEVLETIENKRLATAFSGGVDSVTLARAAEIVLGKENILLLFADSCFAPSGEKAFALEWAKARKLECVRVAFDPLADDEIAVNSPNRCYFCKKALYTALIKEASARGFQVLADGENLDIRGYGMLVLDKKSDEEKLFSVIRSISVKGKVVCSQAVKTHYGIK